MIDLQALTSHLDDAISKAIDREAHRLQGTVAVNEAVCSTLKKPWMIYPDDVMIVISNSQCSDMHASRSLLSPQIHGNSSRMHGRPVCTAGELDINQCRSCLMRVPSK